MEIHVTFRRTSRLSIRVGKTGKVSVSAPLGCSRREVERFIEEHRQWAQEAVKRVAQRVEKEQAFYAQLPLETRSQRQAAAARLKDQVLPLVERYAAQMKVRPTAVTCRATTSKWGSCQTRTGRLQFSTYLQLLPPLCVEYVVVHELAHLQEPNHGPRFYALLERHFPQWKEAKRLIAQALR